MDVIESLWASSASAIVMAAKGLVTPAVFFLALWLVLRRKHLMEDTRRVLPETWLNLKITLLDTVLVVPLIAFGATFLSQIIAGNGLYILSSDIWSELPAPAVAFLAVFLGDFIGYWRHRLEHSALLWPSHAVHHSDTEMTWFTLVRFHPINRLSTFVIDAAFLMLLGLPAWAVVANNLVRHYYGYLIHADLPWTYGPFGKLFVSPVMHRWHHAADARAFNTNYATVFSLFDRVFGTFRVPGPCLVSLGVTDEMEPTLAGQILYAFKPRAYRRLFRPKSPHATARARENSSGQ